jgi:phosphohistidine phosphatase
MKLYLMRHGIAVTLGERGVGLDEERMLTDEGIEKTRSVMRALSKACRPQRVWTSPLVRARETAEIACEILRPSAPLSTLDILKPGTEPARIVRWLSGRKEDSLMLVGHMPDLALWAATLTARVAEESINLRKAGVCCLEFDGGIREGEGRLEWLVTPSLLSKIES